jgi:valyl-tRNA synthetase
MPVPDKPFLEGLEDKWAPRWEAAGTYRFDRGADRDQVYSIDTPPLTVSGSLHVGHAFSFTHTDTIARYKRMCGLEVFYPMGWDDNGLATERRVQNYFGVRCDPSLPYEGGFTPPTAGKPARGQEAEPVSRPNFIELCERLVEEDEKAFEAVWRRIGLSCDWTQYYTTMDATARRASQRGFLRLLARGEAYTAEAPTLWDIDFATAVAQAELEDREVAGAYYRLVFHGPGDRDVLIDTTRPELLSACVAVVVHPGDERFADLVGSGVRSPLFGVDVPVVTHYLADRDKGTGMAMICTFGDATDVVWWRELNLPVRAIVGRDGRLLAIAPPGLPAKGVAIYENELAGLTVNRARSRTAELLAESDEMVGEPRAIRHPVKFYERGDRPLEIVTSRQWFYRTLTHAGKLLERGRQLHWHPPYMATRYTNWVQGLTGDWLISRQRFFGVPFPVWYRLDNNAEPDYDDPLVPQESDLPVDPSTDSPPGFTEAQRGKPGGFVADPDVMDTWATSSLTPEIAGRWEDDPDLFQRVFPMDLRPQAHEIIRTWLFTTILRSQLEFGVLPWSHAAISGWVVDPDRKKMSKSKGNVVTPMDLLEKYGSDAVRYWAASARPGTDTAFDEGQMRIGRKLAIKILNVSRFVLQAGADTPAGAGAAGSLPVSAISEPLDLALCASLGRLVEEATTAFESYDYARALERTEAFFWSFCDDFVELVKNRAYGSLGPDRSRSARAALLLCLDFLLRLFAPFLPYVTEEAWSWFHDAASIHRRPWPSVGELPARPGQPEVLAAASDLLGEIRRVKSEAGLSLRAPVATVRVVASPEHVARLDQAADDLHQAGSVSTLQLVASPEATSPTVDIEFA